MAYKQGQDYKKRKSMTKNMKDKYFTFIFILGSILSIFILVFVFTWLRDSVFLASDLVKREFYADNTVKMSKPLDIFSDPKLESLNKATVDIYYFSDFSCDFCLDQLETIKDVYAEYSDNLRVVWKDYPEANFNSYSYQAARAARCAQQQGAFWDYSRMLKLQDVNFLQSGQTAFSNIASDLNLNVNKFNACMNDDDVDSLILANIREAASLGISAIPYIYINSMEFVGGLNKEELINIIEMEINKD